MEIILKILLFLIIFKFLLLVKDFIYEKNVINKVVLSFEDIYRKRVENEEKRKEIQGNALKDGFFNKFDLMLERSGLKVKYPFLNSEFYIVIILMVAVGMYFTSLLIYRYWVFNIIFFIASIFLGYMIVYYKSGHVFEKIDDNVISFINNIENFSSSSVDIITIFESVIPYTDEPLAKYLREFVGYARSSGDIKNAFAILEKKIENEKLVNMFKNLEISSRNNANYSEIIRESRETLKKYFNSKTKRKILISNGRATIATLMLIGVIMLFLVNAFVDGILLHYLKVTLFGNIWALFGIFIIIMALWFFISLDRG